MDKLHEESRKQFEYEAGKALRLPTSIIELARKDGGYDHAFDSMSIMQPLNGWWYWWQASRASIVVELPEMEDFELLDESKVKDSLRSIGLSIKGE
ncbi:hypothetical protein V6305_09335 [Serratia marcescens]|uniref:hypothetical protein n=1 Tax=Serratia marcescens TaxID=615 RepID=UPI0036F63461